MTLWLSAMVDLACYNFGAVVVPKLSGCGAMACAKCAGTSEENLFKNAKGRLY